jgi:hypothetical protein
VKRIKRHRPTRALAAARDIAAEAAGENEMHPDQDMARVVNQKRYAVKTSTLIASDEYWDGHNFERHGRNTFLYRTAQGNYFTVTLSQWQGEQDSLEPIDQDAAIELFEGPLTEHEVSYKEAFPNVTVEDA